MSLMDMPRGHILVPPYIDVNTAPYFVGRGTYKAKHHLIVNYFVAVKDGDRIIMSIDCDNNYRQPALQGEWLGLSDNNGL